jgi:signal-transduction protein with cAMP-binding, CBS, and nucleotidyltransferase domain
MVKLRVRDAMCPVSAVVGPEHTLRQASVRMVQNRTGAAVVIDGSFPGPCVITERDLLIALSQGMDPDVEKVADHMTGQLVTAAPSWPLARAAALMVKHGVRHVIVFDGEDLSGILSMRDVVRVSGIAEHLDQETETETAAA